METIEKLEVIPKIIVSDTEPILNENIYTRLCSSFGT